MSKKVETTSTEQIFRVTFRHGKNMTLRKDKSWRELNTKWANHRLLFHNHIILITIINCYLVSSWCNEGWRLPPPTPLATPMAVSSTSKTEAPSKVDLGWHLSWRAMAMILPFEMRWISPLVSRSGPRFVIYLPHQFIHVPPHHPSSWWSLSLRPHLDWIWVMLLWL